MKDRGVGVMGGGGIHEQCYLRSTFFHLEPPPPIGTKEIGDWKWQLLPQVPQKNRTMTSQIAAIRNRKFQTQNVLCIWDSKDKSKVPKLSEKESLRFLGGAISNRSVSTFPKSQRFRDAKLERVMCSCWSEWMQSSPRVACMQLSILWGIYCSFFGLIRHWGGRGWLGEMRLDLSGLEQRREKRGIPLLQPLQVSSKLCSWV